MTFLPSGIERPGPFRAYIAERGGAVWLEELRYQSLRFTRPLNQAGTAMVTVGAASSGMLGFVRSYEHEVLIVLDNEVVWAGPVVKPQWRSDQVTIPAQDVGFGWLGVRQVVRDHEFVNHDVADIAHRLIVETLDVENTMGLHLIVHPQGSAGSEDHKRAQHQMIGDALRSLVTKGLQFTVMERTLLLGPPELPALTVTDEVLQQQQIDEGDTATVVTLVGAQTPGVNQPVEWTSGSTTRVRSEAGMVERTITDQCVIDLETAISVADRSEAASFPPPVLASGLLAPGALAFRDLVPGREFLLALSGTDRRVNETSNLLQVDVSASAGQQDVALSFGPIPSA